VRYVNHEGPRDQPDLARDLRVVGVEVVCTTTTEVHRYRQLRGAGYAPVLNSTYYRCLHRA
jgi:hypothetical protein